MNYKCYLTLGGDFFSPSSLELHTGIVLSNKQEPGELGRLGKYRGKPIPYGSAIIEAVELKYTYAEAVDFLSSIIDTRYDEILKYGVTEITLWIIVFHNGDEQVNLEIFPHVMKILADRKISIAISYY